MYNCIGSFAWGNSYNKQLLTSVSFQKLMVLKVEMVIYIHIYGNCYYSRLRDLGKHFCILLQFGAFFFFLWCICFQVLLVLQNPPANANIRDVGLIPGLGRSPEELMATQSSIRAWRIPWTEEHGGLQSKWSSRVGQG